MHIRHPKQQVSKQFLFNNCRTLFLRDSGWEFQTVGPKTEKDLFPKVLNELSARVRTAQRPRRTVWIRKVKYMVAYCSDRYTENRQAILYWILAFTGSQWSVLNSAVALACMDLEDKSGCMILYVLKLIQLLSGIPARRELQKSNLERNSKFVGRISGQAGVDFPILGNWQNKIWHKYLICTSKVKTKVCNRLREWYITTSEMDIGARLGVTWL